MTEEVLYLDRVLWPVTALGAGKSCGSVGLRLPPPLSWLRESGAVGEKAGTEDFGFKGGRFSG